MIKNILLTFTLLGSMLASGQDAYQGHLWKISGNGLEKPSFLYGTMHVSNKVAFHLSDSFYKAIASVDVVALEINPEKWMETMTTDPYIADNYGNVFSIRGDYNRDGFYKSIFKLEEPENKDIGTGLSQELGILNSLLYRTSKLNADFQEDTYLDLFIYQAGKKQGKEITGLEQLGITMKLNEIAAKPEEDKKVRKALKKAAEKRRHVVTKLLDGKAYGEVMEDAYRRGDLEFLDSLSRMSSEVKSHDLIIVYRNKIMADNMDSIMQKKSLFAGVGAAHLANTYGMINLLREKGYTVTAVDRTKSDFGRDSKDKLEETFITQSFKNHQSFDGSFSLSMPGELYEFPESSNSMMAAYPDMPNGATYVITRMFTFAPLYGKTPEIYMEKIDSLLFENIPGKIISNDRIEIDGVPGFDIVNETKKGDFQRYHIMVTPIEIVIFKIGGKKEFAKRPEINQYFDNLKFHHKDGEWTTYTPRNNAYQVDMPGTLVYEGEGTEFMRGFWKKTVQSYDKNEGYFAVLNRSYSDWEYMEEDSFELSQMCRHFIEELEYTAVSKGVDSMGRYASYNVVATKDSVPNLYVRAVAKADQYYLIFGQTENKSSYDKFLNSFEFKDFEYSRKFEMKYDTARLFSVETNIRPPRERSYYRYYDDDDSDDSHESEEKSAVYYSKQTDEAIYTRYKKFHKYYGENHVDSIWKSNKERISENGSFVVYNEKKFQKDGMDYYDLEMGDTNTNRNFYARYIVKGGLMYSLFTETDKHRPKSKFVTTFFETFTPWDTIIGTDVIQNKTEMYLADLNSDDSTTREAAYNSWWKVNFEDEDAPKLISTYEKLYGNEHGIDLRRYILYKLGRLKHPQVVPFLEKKYEEIGDTMGFQIAILSSLAHQKTKKTSRSFAKLLLAETPLSSDGDDIEALFWPFYDSLSLAKELYPQVTMLTALSEYKGEVYNLLSRMLDSGIIKPKMYKKKLKQIVWQANNELKRQKSEYDYGSKDFLEESSRYRLYQYNTLLNDYANILMPYYKNGAVKKLISRMEQVNSPGLQLDLAVLKVKNNVSVPSSTWARFCENENDRMELYTRLRDIDKLSLFPEVEYSDLVRSLYAMENGINLYKDSLLFVKKEKVIIGKDTGYLHFFKSKEIEEKDDDWEYGYIGLLDDDNQVIPEEVKYYEDRVRFNKFEDEDLQLKMARRELEMQDRKRYRVSDEKEFEELKNTRRRYYY